MAGSNECERSRGKRSETSMRFPYLLDLSADLSAARDQVRGEETKAHILSFLMHEVTRFRY